MPLEPGTSNDVVSSNISEFEKGKHFSKTKQKYGKKRAQKQAVAVALDKKRKSKRTARKRA